MAYEVKNIREVNYRRMSDEERKEVWRLDDLRSQQMTTSFDDDGDYYALYEDVDRDADNDPDDRKYAVYLHNSGKLLCLLADCTVALNGYNDTDYGNTRSKLYKQIAIAAGWPEVLPKKRYILRLMRECYVEVHADNHNQAWDIGERIAKIANEEYISDDCTSSTQMLTTRTSSTKSTWTIWKRTAHEPGGRTAPTTSTTGPSLKSDDSEHPSRKGISIGVPFLLGLWTKRKD